MRYMVGFAVVAWLAVSALDRTGGSPSVPKPQIAARSAPSDDCHCLIPPNHGLYR